MSAKLSEATIHLRLPHQMRQELERLAALEERRLSDLVRIFLRRGITAQAQNALANGRTFPLPPGGAT